MVELWRSETVRLSAMSLRSVNDNFNVSVESEALLEAEKQGDGDIAIQDLADP